MRQVPKYLLLGSGRLAHHLKIYFQMLNHPLELWSRDNNPDFNSLNTQIDSSERLKQQAKSCSHILLAVSDSSIETLALSLPGSEDQTLIHFSGALSFENIYSAHPLASFSKQILNLEDYKKIAFVTETNQPSFKSLFPMLENPSHAIPKEQKLIYHCYCVMGSNFSNILWQKSFAQFESLGLTKEHIVPFIKHSFENIINAPNDSLTGPLSRGDTAITSSHLDLLKGSPDYAVYKSFVENFAARKPYDQP